MISSIQTPQISDKVPIQNFSHFLKSSLLLSININFKLKCSLYTVHIYEVVNYTTCYLLLSRSFGNDKLLYVLCIGAIFIHSVSFMGIFKGKLSFFVFFYCHFLHEGPKSLRCPLSHRLSKNRCVTSVKKLSHGRLLPSKCRWRDNLSFGNTIELGTNTR
jgi:hypothetical protein